MKKIYLFASLALGLSLSAQQKQVNAELGNLVKPQNMAASIASQTTTAFIPGSFTNSSCTITAAYGAGTNSVSGGYVAGNNRFGDKEKAMRYSLSDMNLALPGTVGNVSVFLGVKKAGGPGTGVLSVKVYADNAGMPGALLGTSATKVISTLTAGSYTANIFTFATPVALTTNAFFVSVDFSGAGQDTLGIAQSVSGCTSTSTLSAWEMDNTNAWGDFKSDWNLTTDLGIFPVVTADMATPSTGIKTNSGDLTVLSAFPNPATSELNINFGLNQPGKVEISVMDVTGKVVSTLKLDELPSGNHTTAVDVSGLNAGVYMYSIKANNAQLFNKFTVIK